MTPAPSLTAGLTGRLTQPAFIGGFVVALAATLLIGEAFARLSLPRDIRTSLGQGPAEKGIYKPDPQLGVDYRSYDDFRTEFAVRLAELGPLESPKPTWLLFGNSFVHGHEMLAFTARRALPEMRILDLQITGFLPLRAAQARHLLSAGLRPQRIFFMVMPVDLLQIGSRPLSYIAVSPEGAIATRLRFPEAPWGSFVTGSRLATIAWIRSGSADGDPAFRGRDIAATPSPRVQSDLSRIFGHLAETSRRHTVPVTIVTIPNREQVLGRAGHGFQDAVQALTRQAGLDYYDTSGLFAGITDKLSLFMPDWHFNERGNALLLNGLIEHARAASAPSGSPKPP